MTALKHIESIGVLAKNEVTYNTAVTLSTATDGVQIIKPRPIFGISHLYDGKRPTAQAGGFGQIQRGDPFGRMAKGTIKIEPKGNGAAYTTGSIVVPSMQALLRACGLDAAETVTGGSEKWVFTPTPSTGTPASATIGLYGAGELWTLAGCYGTFGIDIPKTGIPVFSFDMAGTLAALITDVALPAITYHNQLILPPVANGAVFTIGAYVAGIIRSANFVMGRIYDTPRVNLNTVPGHAGFQPGQRTPVLKIVLEETALVSSPFVQSTGIDPYSLTDAGTVISPCSIAVGTVQYNRWNLAFPNGLQVVNAIQQDDQGVAMWELECWPFNSTQGAVDDFSLTFN